LTAALAVRLFSTIWHLSGRPGGCHDLLLIAIGDMVAAPILVVVIMLTQHTDIYYAYVKNIFAPHI
jgi:hypothetical protein